MFLTEAAVVQLRPGETPGEACFVNPWFSRTSEEALPRFEHDPEKETLRLMELNKFGRGLRIITTLKREWLFTDWMVDSTP